MLPINRLDKFLFICLYNFANSFKLYIYILAIYITINIYFGINDGQIAIAFVFCFMMLILLAIDLNDKFKREFNRYKKISKKLKESDHIKDDKMQLEFNTVTIILLTMLVIGIILAIGKFDYEKR